MNEAINDGSKLVAQALEKLKYFESLASGEYDHSPEVQSSIDLLEKALEKLSSSIGQ